MHKYLMRGVKTTSPMLLIGVQCQRERQWHKLEYEKKKNPYLKVD